MAWSFRRSTKIGPFRLNFSKSGVGISAGVKGFRVGRTASGRSYTSVGIPGTGLYSKQYSGTQRRTRHNVQPVRRASGSVKLGVFLTIVGLIGLIFSTEFGLIALVLGLLVIIGPFFAPRRRLERAIGQALNLLEQNEYQAALNRLSPFRRGFASEPVLLAGLGTAHDGLGQGREAEKCFRALHEAAPGWPGAFVYAEQLRKNGKQHDAISLLQANVPEEEHAAEHYTLLGNCFLDMGDVETAIDSLKRGPLLKRNLDEDLLGLHMTLGKALEQAGDTKGAIKEYQKVRSGDIQFQDVEERLQRLTGGRGQDL